MAENIENKGAASAIGSVVATIVLAAVCVAGGWIAKDMWPKKPVGQDTAAMAAAMAAMQQTVAVTNADNSLMTKGQEVFFELEQWHMEEESRYYYGREVEFTLYVTEEDGKGSYTSSMAFAFGQEIHVALTGSREKGYRITPMD